MACHCTKVGYRGKSSFIYGHKPLKSRAFAVNPALFNAKGGYGENKLNRWVAIIVAQSYLLE
ncbi:MAG TPA: hypothetical protein DCW52_13195 [Gammaproteobacteria bacterium]|nr:hypothetical protein [Gammaproteobacteria bacterium]